jgi:hypothetical protein
MTKHRKLYCERNEIETFYGHHVLVKKFRSQTNCSISTFRVGLKIDKETGTLYSFVVDGGLAGH